jgi:hypothetical protein
MPRGGPAACFMSLRAIQCWHPRCKHHGPVKYYYPSFTVEFLVLSASVVILLGFCWLLGVLTRSASDGTPVTWRHAAITTVLCAASSGVIAYLIW